MLGYYAPFAIMALVLIALCLFFVWLIRNKKTVIVRIESESEQSYSKKDVLPFLLATLSLFLSIFVLSYTMPIIAENGGVNYSYVDVVIAILSLLITILLGWQIYNGIKFNEIVDNVKSSEEKATKAVETVTAVADKVNETEKLASDLVFDAQDAANKAKTNAQNAANMLDKIRMNSNAALNAMSEAQNVAQDIRKIQTDIESKSQAIASSQSDAEKSSAKTKAVQKTIEELSERLSADYLKIQSRYDEVGSLMVEIERKVDELSDKVKEQKRRVDGVMTCKADSKGKIYFQTIAEAERDGWNIPNGNGEELDSSPSNTSGDSTEDGDNG